MSRTHEGAHDASGRKVAVIAGRFNDFVTSRLVTGAVECLARHGAAPDDVDVYWVPGAFEVPQMARRVASDGNVDGIVCLGAIIRGETNHFDILCDDVIRGVSGVAAASGVPVAYGVLSAENVDQAMARAGGKNGNKGWESTLALIEMMSLWGSDRG